MPSLEVDVQSDIPMRSGLGSSAAATIAGLRLREVIDGKRSGDEILAAASKLEGHPDNAAAALFGGVTSCCVWGEGVDTLLPRTDVVSLVRPNCPESHVIGSWGRVCEVVGDLMEPVGLYPERYRVMAFPSEEQLRAIASPP